MIKEMSTIDKLLEGVEVQWITLGNDNLIEIANSGRKPVKGSNRIMGEVPYYGANNIQDYVNGYTHNGTFVLIAEDGTASIENYSIQWATGKFWANNHVHVIRGKENLDSRFLFHYLKTVNFIPFLSGGGRAKLTKGKLIEIPIPIPPLPVQAEIVRILDTFTELTTELTIELKAELTARKKQYNFYREQLLNFDLTTKNTKNTKEVVWKTLGEALVRTKGTNITAGQMRKLHKDGAPLKIFAGGKTIAFFNYDDIPFKDINREPSIIVKSRGIIEFEYYDKAFSHKNEMWSYHSKNENINIKFVYYFLKIHEPYFKNIASRMQMPQISTPDTDKFKIPIPSLEEQARIVSILDTFDTLTTSISEGLPKEIELRKKQYEYYRDLLLSFNTTKGTKDTKK